jgi:hypothetical protein
LQLAQERAVNILEAVYIGIYLLGRTPAAQKLKDRKTMGLHEVKKLLHSKRNVL